MKGVLLAGGKGTRLGELTRVTNKHLLPVGLYPMICHPLRKMTEAGVTDIMIVSGTEHVGDFVSLLGSGRHYGCELTYRVQDEAGGIAQALGLAKSFCGNDRCLVVLGDNIFEDSLRRILVHSNMPGWAWVVLKRVQDPQRYGVARLADGIVTNIEEKPKKPKGSFAVVGIYIYPPEVFKVIDTLKPSERGELEITDVNRHFMNNGRLGHTILDGYWTDAGTHESLLLANQLVMGKK